MAKGTRDAGDDAQLAAAGRAVAEGGLAFVVRRERGEGQLGALGDFGGGDDVGHAPAVRVSYVHELDHAQDVLRAGEAVRHRGDLVVVHAALYDHVDLDGREACGQRGINSGEHAGDGEVGVVHRAESGVVQRVEAHGEPVQPGLAEGAGFFGKDGAVRGERDVLQPRRVAHHADERLHIAPQEWLAAGEPQLFHAERCEDADEPRAFLQRENLRTRQEVVAAPEDLARHTISAAKIAPVRDRQAQVAKWPVTGVVHRAYPWAVSAAQ